MELLREGVCERVEKGRREEGGAAGGRGDPARVGGQEGSDGAQVSAGRVPCWDRLRARGPRRGRWV